MNVLGISALDNDANAALFVDGQLRYAMGEERLSRQKLHNGFPVEPCRRCSIALD